MSTLIKDGSADFKVWQSLATPIWVFDVGQQRMQWANESGLSFWGAKSVCELEARQFCTDSVTVGDRLNAIFDVTQGRSSFQDTWTLYPDGVPKTVVLSFQQVSVVGEGRYLLVEMVQEVDPVEDKTPLRIAEAALSTTSMMTMMTLTGRVLVQNPSALKCYGPPLPASSDELDVYTRFADPDVAAQVLSAGQNNEILQIDADVVTLSGRRMHSVCVKRGRDPANGDTVILVNEEDVSVIAMRYRDELKRSTALESMVNDRTERLRITQERMRRGLKLAAIWDWDVKTNTLFFSPNFIKLLGYKKSELYDKLRKEGFESIIHPECYVDYPAKLENILANPDKPLSLELRFMTKSGAALWIQIEGHCYADDDGKPIRTAGLLTNVTNKKRLEEKLVSSQKLEAIGRLTGGIAHDFNNLLTVIQGNIQLLQEMGQADDELTSEIVNAVQRGAELTRHLLAFAGKQSLDPAPLDISLLLCQMRSTLLRVLSGNIVTIVEAQEGLWPVFVDAAQTEAAVLNVALNARDVMPNGGQLKIHAENVIVDSANAPVPTTLDPGEYVKIAVSDTGPGMTDAVIARAFEPFFTTKEVGKGSGLGLSIVLGFSQQSGGDTQIESEPGVGTTISIYLPRANNGAT